MFRLNAGKVTTAAAVLVSIFASSACSRSAHSAWNIETKSDQMSDVGVTSATTTLLGDAIDLEVLAACDSTGKIAYRFRAFNKQNKAEDFQTVNWGGSLAKALEIRLDGGTPKVRHEFAHDFTNQVLLSDGNTPEIAAANIVVIRAFFVHGEETYTMDQSADAVRSALAPCTGSPSSTPTSTAAPTSSQPLVGGADDDMPDVNKSDADSGVVAFDQDENAQHNQ